MFFYKATFDKDGMLSYEKVFCPPSIEEINHLKSLIQSNICRHDEKTEFFRMLTWEEEKTGCFR